MSFFRGPNDSSSSESSSEEEDEEELETSLNDFSHNSARESSGTAEVIEPDITTESLSLTHTISNGEDGALPNLDQAKDMMMAAVLEELTRYKAAEMLNAADAGSGRTFNKDSPEVQEFAKAMYARSSNALNEVGVMSADAASERKSSLRKQYMTGLHKFSYHGSIGSSRRSSGDRGRAASGTRPSTALVRRQSQQPAPFQSDTAGHFQQVTWEMDNMNIIPRPSTELQLVTQPSMRIQSQYRMNFEEKGILGRGGFGRVFRTYNVLDQREYAVKKIPLSPKLSQRYHDGGHEALAHILREVQALAQLDHCNIVRYHATWIEAPTAPAKPSARPQPIPMRSFRGQMLLDDKPAPQSSPPQGKIYSISPDSAFNDPFEGTKDPLDDLPSVPRIITTSSEEVDDDDKDSFDPFARSNSQPANDDQLLWSSHPSHQQSLANTDNPDDNDDSSNPFTDGRSRRPSSQLTHLDDPTVYVLHVQMTMYPLTLAEYLLPTSSPHRSSNSHIASQRHCFHLIPALRLLLSILCGLQYIHAHGFIHRDIKPSNIFLSTLDFANPLAFNSEHGYVDIGSCPSCIRIHTDAQPRYINPRIGDFGLVKELERASVGGLPGSADSHSNRETGADGKGVGTEYYRPPPHTHAAECQDERIDVFALGVILLELLWSCGTRMERIGLLRGAQRDEMPRGMREKLRGEGHGEGEGEGESGGALNGLEKCIAGMIEVDPRKRWRCGMVKEGLEGVLAQLSRQRSGTSEEPD